MHDIKSAMRPALDHESGKPVRMLHEQYDRLFKAIVSGGWDTMSGGDVEAPTGFFTLICNEYDECQEMWEAFGNEDNLTESQLKWLWSGILAGYYVTTENSDGIIQVWAYDSLDDARSAFEGMETQFSNWYNEDK